MASSKLKRDFPYLAEYLEFPHPNPRLDSLYRRHGLGCMAAVVGGPIFGLATFVLMGRALGPVVGLMLTVFATLLGAIAISAFARKITARTEAKSLPEDHILEKANESTEQLNKLDQERKLTKWMDPVALQLLEAGSYHWSRVRKSFADTRWNSQELPEHWVSLKEKADHASNIAMAELLILCSQCIGEPIKTGKNDFQSVIEDFVDLDIEDALRGLARATATHPKEYRFSSQRTHEIFPEAKALAERLKELADEIEQATQIAKVEIPGLRASLGQDSIESLLSEMRTVRQAEDELRQHQSE